MGLVRVPCTVQLFCNPVFVCSECSETTRTIRLMRVRHIVVSIIISIGRKIIKVILCSNVRECKQHS